MPEPAVVHRQPHRPGSCPRRRGHLHHHTVTPRRRQRPTIHHPHIHTADPRPSGTRPTSHPHRQLSRSNSPTTSRRDTGTPTGHRVPADRDPRGHRIRPHRRRRRCVLHPLLRPRPARHRTTISVQLLQLWPRRLPALRDRLRRRNAHHRRRRQRHHRQPHDPPPHTTSPSTVSPQPPHPTDIPTRQHLPLSTERSRKSRERRTLTDSRRRGTTVPPSRTEPSPHHP